MSRSVSAKSLSTVFQLPTRVASSSDLARHPKHQALAHRADATPRAPRRRRLRKLLFPRTLSQRGQPRGHLAVIYRFGKGICALTFHL